MPRHPLHGDATSLSASEVLGVKERSSRPRFVAVVFVVIAALLCGTMRSTDAAPQGEARVSRPTFSATVHLVRTDATATDEQGLAVHDLRPGEFILEQDGEQQRLLDVWFVTTVAEAVADRQESGPRRAESATSSEPVPTGGRAQFRHLLFVVDDEHMRPENALRVARGLEVVVPTVWQAGDTASLISTAVPPPGVPQVATDASGLLAQVRILRAVQQESRALPPALGCDEALPDDPLAGGISRGTLEPVERALATQSFPDRRTVVLLLTDGLVDARCRTARFSVEERLRRLADFATRRNAVIYGLVTRPLSSGLLMPEYRAPDADSGRRPPSHTSPSGVVRGYLRTVAERTGGLAIRSNDIGGMIERAVTHQAGYYILSYEPPAGTFTHGARARYVTLSVRCTRPGVTCRGRSGF